MSTTPDAAAGPPRDDDTISRQQWKWTGLAGMASYLDAGSIVALASGLTVFQDEFGLSDTGVGVLAAIGPNAIGCAVGAFVGGRLGDRLGRKRIYQWDLLVYAFGIALIALAVHPAMLFVGTVIVGVAVGADVPTSLALVGEFAPDRARGRLLGLTQVAWYVGPVVVLLLALVLDPLGVLGTRLVFASLFVVALVTWALRRGIAESARWRSASELPGNAAQRVRTLLRGNHLKALLYTGTFYMFWNLAAGTAGIFTPYMVTTIGAGSNAAGVALSCLGFAAGIVGTLALFMPFYDRSHGVRKGLFALGAVMQIGAYGLYLVVDFTVLSVIASVLLFYVGSAVAGEATYKVTSQELFPTMLRGTAQGLTFGVARVVLGVFSLVVPLLSAIGIVPVALLLTFFLLVSGVVGYLAMPDTTGKSLERIEAERADPAPTTVGSG
ncbi:MFS transporter [Actinomycetospora sp. NBRC 106375]|uniref:MFS transporter n=1 Tax=Actinomycetospora sp. NBRC 106375 TaxID=3032207 RepID=UPI0024A47157|nr:MFS transporter [Actinomycetospora sp. NBRC 106375]GLZ46291.1 MFS transporter [Actinomycetospora sp. NBRC 106375]